MICFHFTTFAVLETAVGCESPLLSVLWFAFILLPLPYWKQHSRCRSVLSASCDLLSFYYLCRTGNSDVRRFGRAGSRCDLLSFYYLCRTGNSDGSGINTFCGVVICFHFTTFAVLETATYFFDPTAIPLWFAFILLPLPYWKQRPRAADILRERCDLLSFYYLCRTGNSGKINQMLLFPLWFAFILLPLPYWKQHKPLTTRVIKRCDLLSFYYLCRTGNSIHFFS